MKGGSLIAFEGIDGSGKSTQAAALTQILLAEGHDVVLTGEPTGGSFGRRLREIAASSQPPDAREILRWFHEDRREHVTQVIRPALAAGRVVVTDRYFLSSVAYQGALGIDPGEILRMSEADHPIPSLVLLLEIDAAAGLARVRRRSGPAEPLFERLELLERVTAIYHELDLPYLVHIDARHDEIAVHGEIRLAVAARLGLLPAHARSSA